MCLNHNIKRFTFPASAVVICDRHVRRLVNTLFPQYRQLVLPSGENTKRLATVEKICQRLVVLGCDRQTSIIAVGGGVISDIAGLVAAVFMRGVPLYLVPTTLLAMVDASIGGKNGVDLPNGKNLIGTFYQPQAIVLDPRFLLTLPTQQFAAGMAEVVKHSILEASLFPWIEQHRADIQRRRLSTLRQLITRNVAIKQAVVTGDVTETSTRMLLNLGHTFAHAFERLSRYTLPHGPAVAIGLAYATALGQMPERDRVMQLLHYFGLPTRLPRPYTPKAIVRAMLSDKKHRGRYLTVIVPQRLGEVIIDPTFTPAAVQRWLERYQPYDH